jgi:hypothetical protein
MRRFQHALSVRVVGNFALGFSEIESRSSGIPPGCEIASRSDPGVSSLALLNPRLISVTPTGVKTRLPCFIPEG